MNKLRLLPDGRMRAPSSRLRLGAGARLTDRDPFRHAGASPRRDLEDARAVAADLKTITSPSFSPPAGIPARPRFSIVTPSLNHKRFIQRAVDSVLGQSGDFDLEYFVVDGGSTDGTLAILREYEGRLQWSSEADRGQVDAIN